MTTLQGASTASVAASSPENLLEIDLRITDLPQSLLWRRNGETEDEAPLPLQSFFSPKSELDHGMAATIVSWQLMAPNPYSPSCIRWGEELDITIAAAHGEKVPLFFEKSESDWSGRGRIEIIGSGLKHICVNCRTVGHIVKHCPRLSSKQRKKACSTTSATSSTDEKPRYRVPGPPITGRLE